RQITSRRLDEFRPLSDLQSASCGMRRAKRYPSFLRRKNRPPFVEILAGRSHRFRREEKLRGHEFVSRWRRYRVRVEFAAQLVRPEATGSTSRSGAELFGAMASDCEE